MQTSEQLQNIQSKKEIRHKKFTEEEDSQLRTLVQQFGSDSWDDITTAMNGQRTKRQLRERWQNYLSPALIPSYSETEDCALLTLYRQIGPQWAKIATMIGKKSAISTRNRYRSLQAMKARGVKPDYLKIEECHEIHEMNRINPLEPSLLEVPEFNFLMNDMTVGDSWECEFEGFF
jgi:preprotein translocase subunit SecA